MDNVMPENKAKLADDKNRVLYFDVLNILACLCVIFLHMNGIVHGYSTSRAWGTALIFEVICYWAVPVFIMLTGATLLKYRERYDTKTFFKKRFIKVLVPWVIWSVIVFIIKNKSFSCKDFIGDFLYSRIETIYWFFPLILFLYCLIPVLSIFTQKKEYRTILKTITIFMFIVRGIIYPIYIILDKNIPTMLSYFIGINPYIIFLILGYLLSTHELSKKKRIIIYVCGIISALIRYFYTYYFSTKEGILNKDLFDYCSALSISLATAVFVYIKSIDWNKIITKLHINQKTLAKISSCSFGIYLIHMLVKSRLTNFFGLSTLSIWYRTIGALILYLICLLIVYLIKKIPIVKNIVP